MAVPELRTKDPVRAQGRRLVAVADLPPSNVCRHQFAKLGQGQVRDGCLECPWHRARYDVTTGAMTSGPKGRIFGFGPYSRAIQAYTNTGFRLRRFPVELRDGAIVLA